MLIAAVGQRVVWYGSCKGDSFLYDCDHGLKKSWDKTPITMITIVKKTKVGIKPYKNPITIVLYPQLELSGTAFPGLTASASRVSPSPHDHPPLRVIYIKFRSIFFRGKTDFQHLIFSIHFLSSIFIDWSSIFSIQKKTKKLAAKSVIPSQNFGQSSLRLRPNAQGGEVVV